MRLQIDLLIWVLRPIVDHAEPVVAAEPAVGNTPQEPAHFANNAKSAAPSRLGLAGYEHRVWMRVRVLRQFNSCGYVGHPPSY